jgi:hypothetical protein
MSMARSSLASHLGFGAQTNTRENKMRQLLKMTAAPATALFAMAFVAMTTPASAGEFCSTNTSGMRSCGFSSLEQCQASVIFGSCFRDPFLADAGKAYAYQPKRSPSKSVLKPVAN